MKILKILVITLVLIMSVGAVCAADAVCGDDTGSDGQTILETIQEDDTLETTQNDDYSVGESSFTDLSYEIGNATGVLNLTRDYKFNNETDNVIGIYLSEDNFVINGNGYTLDANDQARIFVINATNVTLNNIKFINANRAHGGAILVDAKCSLTTNNVTFENNTAGEGIVYVVSGTYNSNGDKFLDSTVSEGGVIDLTDAELNIDGALMRNSKQLVWGFIKSAQSNLTVLNSIFRDTVSNYSTAIKADGKSLIKNTQFINLEAKITAGAIALRQFDECRIENCTFDSVRADKNGGAIFADVRGFDHSNDGLLLINGSVFYNCTSGFGGAVLHLGGDLVVDDSRFICNIASLDGGAIYVSNSDVTVTNSMFDFNWAVYGEDSGSCGGAIFCDKSTFDLSYSNLTNNLAHEGSAVYLYDSNYNITNNLFKDNTNFQGYDDDIFTVFDTDICVLENNVYSGKNSTSINNEDYASIVDFEGMRLVLLTNNTINVTTLPSRFDLREMGWLTPVRNQGKKGACWTFGSSGAMESSILRFLGLETDLSENNMEDISLMYYKYGVDGVWEGNTAESASNYALSWLGVFSSDYDVYDQLGKISPIFAVPNSIHFQDVLIIPPRSDLMDNDAMKWAILKYGALFINYYALGSDVDQYYNGTPQINHGVSLVGWDDDREIEGAPGKGAWIIKNSWGTAAGEDGFMYISYYDTSLSTTTSSYAYLLENTVPYNKNYQYDISGAFRYMAFSDQYFNAFVAVDDDLLAAVGTYFNDTGVEYTVKIYVNDELKHVQTGLSPFSGFHTIKLDSYVPIKKGDEFIVEIKSNGFPTLIQSRKHYIQGASQAMVGGEWVNITDYGYVACLKAYTVDSKSFTDLKNDIANAGDVFELNCDYRFDNISDNFTSGIIIDRGNFTIEGNGFTIDANGQSAIFAVASNLTINNLTFINANGSVLLIAKDATVTTNNVNFINSTADNGVIYVRGTYYSNNDTFLDCTADMGVIKVIRGELYVDGAVMTSSKMLNWGFIYTETDLSNITIFNSIFANTTSNYSTAVRGNERTFIRNTKFINLYSEISAGAVAMKNVITAGIEGCTFINVSSQKNGGAVLLDVAGSGGHNGTVSIINSSFVDCRSGFGGAIIQYGGCLEVLYCNFTNNYAIFDGGAIYATQSKVYILNSTFTENYVEYEDDRGSFGGAVYCDSSALYFINNNLTKNSAQYGGAIAGFDLFYYINGNIFEGNTNFNGSFDDVYTTFDDGESGFGVNIFSSENSCDLNNTDYNTIMGGEGMSLVILNNTIDVATLPIKFDLRDWGWVTPVRDQGRTGSCWTFGASGAIESAILRYLGIEMDISENNMEDVSLEYNPYGVVTYTEGALPEMGATYALSWFGVFPSEYDVYDQLGKTSPIIAVANSVHFQDVVFVPVRKNATDNNLLKLALLKYGALSVGYAADQSPPLLNPETSAQYNNETEAPDHSVSLVGWDDHYSASNFLITPPGDGAWIIKNSWGAQNGDEGYYYISYYDVNFATKQFSIAYVLENTVKYNKNYQYDIQGEMKFINVSTEYRNNFVAVDDDLIAAVGTYFNETGVEYTVEVYVNDVLRVTQDGVSPFAGFHTIKLDSYVPIKKGDAFTVKINSNVVPFLVRSRQHYVEGASQVFTENGWENLSDYKEEYGIQFVASIKVYTVVDDTKVINLDNITVDYAGGSCFSVKVVTDDGRAVGAGEVVRFTINNVTYNVTTDENSTAKLEIKEAPGEYTIVTKYNGKFYQNTVTVNNVLTATKATIKKSTAKNLVLAAKLKINGKNVKGKWIKFKLNGKKYYAKTNKYGTAKIVLGKKVINTLNRGIYKVKVYFGNDMIKTKVKVK